MGPLLAAGVALGGNLLQNGLNFGAQSGMNKQQQRFINWQADRQREWALQDYNMQNEYNSPGAQMERLKSAGLNPNLIYGTGTQAAGQAAQIKSVEQKGWNPQAPQFELGGVQNSIFNYLDAKQKDAQINNLQQQTDLAKQMTDAKISEINTKIQESLARTATNRFQLEQANRLADTNFEAAQIRNKKMIADTDFTIASNLREELKTGSGLRVASESVLRSMAERGKIPYEIQQMMQQTENAELDAIMKRYENILNKDDVNKNDPWYLRQLAGALRGIKERSFQQQQNQSFSKEKKLFGVKVRGIHFGRYAVTNKK